MSDVDDDIEQAEAPAKAAVQRFHTISDDVDDDVEQGEAPAKAVMQRSNIEGLGAFLFQMHSKHFNSILYAQEETLLQFYEHLVVATISTRLWCFPERRQKIVIPRFNIVGASFSHGPRNIPTLVWLLLTVSVILIAIGAQSGGCSYSGSSCALLVIGCLVLIIFVPALLVALCFRKSHHLYLDVKTPTTGFPKWFGTRVAVTSYDFRFKKFAFERNAQNQVAFDEFYLIDYVFNPLGKCGTDAMTKYHLLSHFQHASLANPILPLHGDKSLSDFAITAANGSIYLDKQKQITQWNPAAQ